VCVSIRMSKQARITQQAPVLLSRSLRNTPVLHASEISQRAPAVLTHKAPVLLSRSLRNTPVLHASEFSQRAPSPGSEDWGQVAAMANEEARKYEEQVLLLQAALKLQGQLAGGALQNGGTMFAQAHAPPYTQQEQLGNQTQHQHTSFATQQSVAHTRQEIITDPVMGASPNFAHEISIEPASIYSDYQVIAPSFTKPPVLEVNEPPVLEHSPRESVYVADDFRESLAFADGLGDHWQEDESGSTFHTGNRIGSRSPSGFEKSPEIDIEIERELRQKLEEVVGNDARYKQRQKTFLENLMSVDLSQAVYEGEAVEC